MSHEPGVNNHLYQHVNIILTTSPQRADSFQAFPCHGEECWPPTSCLNAKKLNSVAPVAMSKLEAKFVEYCPGAWAVVQVTSDEMQALRTELKAANHGQDPVVWNYPTSFLGTPVVSKLLN